MNEAKPFCLQAAIAERLAQCRLEMHPDKTKIVYCKDAYRRRTYGNVSFDFLGYTFRPRFAKRRGGKFFVSFLPAISKKATKRLRQTMRSWSLQRRSDRSLQDLAVMINPIARGRINYYGRFYRSALQLVLRSLDLFPDSMGRPEIQALSWPTPPSGSLAGSCGSALS